MFNEDLPQQETDQTLSVRTSFVSSSTRSSREEDRFQNRRHSACLVSIHTETADETMTDVARRTRVRNEHGPRPVESRYVKDSNRRLHCICSFITLSLYCFGSLCTAMAPWPERPVRQLVTSTRRLVGAQCLYLHCNYSPQSPPPPISVISLLQTISGFFFRPISKHDTTPISKD